MKTLIGWLILIVLIAVIVLWVVPGLLALLVAAAYVIGMIIYVTIDIIRSNRTITKKKKRHIGENK